jgi:hypothetical protein
MEVIDDTQVDETIADNKDSMFAPSMQFEATMVDDPVMGAGKKKKKKKKKTTKKEDDDEEIMQTQLLADTYADNTRNEEGD